MFKRARTVLRIVATAAILFVAAAVGLGIWNHYTVSPWTRDGQVRVQVADIAPQISGQIVELRVHDNQFVHKGDVLYVIDPFDYQVALASAEATLNERRADLAMKGAENRRRQELTDLSTSAEEKQNYAASAQESAAEVASATASLSQARINLKRTEVRSTVDGYVTNLLLRVGDYATEGTADISVIDSRSYWVDGYFEETKLGAIEVGDVATIRLMGRHAALRGHVESIVRGVSTSNATPSTQGLPSVDPIYTWVRLAQRIPVRIHIDQIPPGLVLAAGMTATVEVAPGSAPAAVAPVAAPQAAAPLVSEREAAHPVAAEQAMR